MLVGRQKKKKKFIENLVGNPNADPTIQFIIEEETIT